MYGGKCKKLFFEKIRYKRMLRDVLKVSYGTKHIQAKESIRKSTVNEALKTFLDILMHDSIEDTARVVYLQSFKVTE